MTIQEFFDKYNGKFVEVAGSVPIVSPVATFTSSKSHMFSFCGSAVNTLIKINRPTINSVVAFNMLTYICKLKILNSIIGNIVIFMMNNFTMLKWPTKKITNNQSMYRHIPLFTRHSMGWKVNKPISFSFYFFKTSNWFSNLIQGVTLMGTKLINMIDNFRFKFFFTIFTNVLGHRTIIAI